MLRRSYESLEVSAASERELDGALEELFRREPALRPRPEEHDYQLTYPPAVQLERDPRRRRRPSDEEYVRLARGAFRAAGYYFHFGFCVYRCRYCFHYELKTKRDEELMTRYVAALGREMAHLRAITPALPRALYFLGGGTPTALPRALMERFLGDLLFHFGPPMTVMSTVEAKPITASDDKLDALVQAGFRRINLGVQTLDRELYAFHHHGEGSARRARRHRPRQAARLRVRERRPDDGARGADAGLVGAHARRRGAPRADRRRRQRVHLPLPRRPAQPDLRQGRRRPELRADRPQRRAGARALRAARLERARRALLPLAAARAARAPRARARPRQPRVRRGALPRPRQLELLDRRPRDLPEPPRRRGLLRGGGADGGSGSRAGPSSTTRSGPRAT
ncbi:MAG: radical SAM protein [Sandaracinaceae bacterium]|nr:radical SAM protein [Sandaracinaceae bacterium]